MNWKTWQSSSLFVCSVKDPKHEILSFILCSVLYAGLIYIPKISENDAFVIHIMLIFHMFFSSFVVDNLNNCWVTRMMQDVTKKIIKLRMIKISRCISLQLWSYYSALFLLPANRNCASWNCDVIVFFWYKNDKLLIHKLALMLRF